MSVHTHTVSTNVLFFTAIQFKIIIQYGYALVYYVAGYVITEIYLLHLKSPFTFTFAQQRYLGLAFQCSFRPIKRSIVANVETPLAQKGLAGEFDDGDTVSGHDLRLHTFAVRGCVTFAASGVSFKI